MLKRIISSWVLLGYLLLCFYIVSLDVSASAVTDDSTITIVNYDYSVLKSGEPSKIEHTLYPSGMRIPTKFFDVLDLQNISGQVYTDDAAKFLNAMHPGQLGKFTYPEYTAAKEFLWFVKSYYFNGGDSSLSKSLNAMSSLYSWNISGNYSNMQLDNSESIHTIATTYEEILNPGDSNEIAPQEHPLYKELSKPRDNGVILTFGGSVNYSLEAITINDGSLVLPDSGFTLSNALLGRSAYWEYLGVKIAETAQNINVQEGTLVLAGNSGTSLFTLESFLVLDEDVTPIDEGTQPDTTKETNPSATQEQGENTENEMPAVTPDVDEEVISSEPTFFTESTNQDAIQSISSGLDGYEYIPADSGSVGKTYGVRDILTILCLIFVSISVIVLWILHTIKERRDPLRKWRM